MDNAAVCQWLNISKRTLQYYRNSGVLPYTVMGNKCYYKSEDVKAVLDRGLTKQK
ncbi:MAG: helix-turn-helix domain-containing protein [Alistipes finegoldii]|uniref:helix-turn-helix domain-containing protein n=1 Tax=Alistipes TaxID=239759 RepID=UPI003561DF2C